MRRAPTHQRPSAAWPRMWPAASLAALAALAWLASFAPLREASGEAAAAGLATFLRFMALFSVNLAILNMLPIPVLDGGHMVFLGIELIRGEKLSVRQRIRWSQVGVWVVVGIMVWALGNDLLRFLGL